MTITKISKKLITMKTLLILLLLQFSVSILTTLPKMPSESEINPAAWSQYEQTIAGFEADDRKLVDIAVTDLNRYFDEMEQNIEPFLDDLYSYTAKGKMLWYLLKDMELKNIEGLPPYLAMLPPLVPVCSGTHLPDFIEGKFNAHFGSTAEINRILNQISGDLSMELSGNNERLSVELGELVPATMKKSAELADKVKETCQFSDQAKRLSMAIVARTSGLQSGIEIAFLAGCETVIARPIAAYIISVLAAEGILVIKGVWSGMLTFGVGAAIAIAVDVVANKISQSTLKPKIEQALQQRRRETLAVFRKTLISRIDNFHRTRRHAIENSLNVGFLFKLKSYFTL